MSRPIAILHHQVQADAAQMDRVERLARQLTDELPELIMPEDFRPLATRHLEDGPTLHLDDLGAIARPVPGQDTRYYQERARLRAGEGDLVAVAAPPVAGYEAYCRERLGLGAAEWLHVPPGRGGDPTRLALACWEDRDTRRRLVQAVRQGGLRALHPHMGSTPAWTLATLLHRAARRPLTVLAPPPGLTRWVNDKVAFAGLVARLFGPAWRPATAAACNYAMLAHRVAALSGTARTLGFKLPDAAGGEGNVVVGAEVFRGRPLREIRRRLAELLGPLRWDGANPLLVSRWEGDVLGAPSAQLWIPPAGQGPPVVEGLFEQILVGRAGAFVGSIGADLPDGLAEEIATRSWLLALLYQRLGYVGRCSFDLLLVGPSPREARAEFIECNGRWGGTSGPMLLMNRLFGDWAARPYASMECHLDGLDELGFEALVEGLGEEVYDRRTGRGRLILFAPGQITSRSGVSYVALGPTRAEARGWALRGVPELIGALIARRTGRGGRSLPLA